MPVFLLGFLERIFVEELVSLSEKKETNLLSVCFHSEWANPSLA